MNNEIKKILDDLLFTTTLPNVSIKLNKEKLNQLKDYITNLQQELENKDNEIDVLKDQVKWWEQQCDDLEMQMGENNG